MKKMRYVQSWTFAVVSLVTMALFLVAGESAATVSQTPPMGWNSYDALNHSVTEAQVKAAADFMAEHLKEYGWEYICIDWAWYYTGNSTSSPNQDAGFSPKIVVDEYSRMLPDPAKFPSSANGQGFKPLADYIHSKGLKMGVHLMRGIPRQAVAANAPIKGSSAKANDIADKVNLCAWLNLMYGLDMNKEGSQAYFNSLFELYASWGIDYVKVDDLINPYGSPAFRESEIEGYRKAIDNCGRDMVFSTSPGATPVADAAKVKVLANQWRIVNDLWDNWDNLNAIFDISYAWYTHAGPGHWPDADMIPIGRLNKHGPTGAERWSKLTNDEKHTMMSLWCIVQSPLIWGGNLVENRAEELELMQNGEVIAVNQKGANSRPIVNGNTPVWCADIPGTGDKYVGLFNRTGGATNVTVTFTEIGFSVSDTLTVRDLWTKADKGNYSSSYTVSVPSHGSVLLRLIGKPIPKRSAYVKIEAESCNTYSGIQLGTCSEGGQKVGYVANRDYAVYTSIDFGDVGGSDGFTARVAGFNDGTIEVWLDSIAGKPVGTCSVKGSGDWETWTTVSCSLSVTTGVHTVYLVFTGSDGNLFDVNWLQFTNAVDVVRPVAKGVTIDCYATRFSNGLLHIVPKNGQKQYDLVVHAPNGRLVVRKCAISGPVAVSVGGKGVYIVRCIGKSGVVEKRIVQY